VTSSDPRRAVPRTDSVLADPRLVAASRRLGPGLVKQAVREVQLRVRDGSLAPENTVVAAVAALPERASSLLPVINATGVVLHTNLGRAPLSEAAVAAVAAAAGYVDVEYDLPAGHRARRGRGAHAALRRALPDAEQVLIVNNAAAALVLATTVLAGDREVVVSRGELIEIGDGFRLPDLIASTGARIREVGTTNRTTVADYQCAIGPRTGCVLKVHPSNFRIQGFTSAVTVGRLAGLGVPVVADVGSGLLVPDRRLPDEPDVTTTLRAGAAVVLCSGDKLLGGPQAGLVAGRTEVLERMRRHPLARALRVDKLTLAALEATLRGPRSPVNRYLHADPIDLRRRCEALAAIIDSSVTGSDPAGAEVVESAGAVGGGGAPGQALPGWAVALPQRYAEALRRGNPAIVGRLERGRCLIDLRCVPDSADAVVSRAILAVGH